MAMEQTQKYCGTCRRYVLAQRPKTNHVLHFLISVLTCGLWVFVWAGSSVKFGGWRCSFCGGTALK